MLLSAGTSSLRFQGHGYVEDVRGRVGEQPGIKCHDPDTQQHQDENENDNRGFH